MQRRRCSGVTPHTLVLVLVAASLANANPAAAANDFAQPPPRMIEMLRRQHDPSDWLIVTTPTGTLELRTRDLGPDGLDAPTRTRAVPAPTTAIAWSEIERIELRHSRFRTGQWLGALTGSVVAFYAGAALNRSDRHTDVYAGGVATPVGALAGAIIGGKIGDRFAGARTLYPLEPVMPLAHADPSPIVIARVSSKDVLRVQGRFSEFAGRVATRRNDPKARPRTTDASHRRTASTKGAPLARRALENTHTRGRGTSAPDLSRRAPPAAARRS